MNHILKYPISLFFLALPKNSKLLHVGMDPQGAKCIWVLGDLAEMGPQVRLHILGTGSDVPDNLAHLGSFKEDFINGPDLMWHVFIERPA